ncbi:hypothetical protein FA95DRAFT_1684342 [Auriscalpium vulgare]|uniref:Uncharacterized protein n=1 Tax=Auriscalpium vulgare TaxID=40419 RepID=A0ACB8R5Y4_9AGAM|nr:hypothetical protein FA95DRAFT_1684342 [Auriscalpium vulgare]
MDDFDAMFERVLDELAAEPYDESVPLTRTARNFPAYGAFVVFTLDPVATVEIFEDPVATEAARTLPARKYVGYVTQVIDLPMPDRRYHRCSCYILSRGLPIFSGETLVDEQMCIAIAPATHPARPALTPSPPLLWNDLYLHSSSIFTLRVTSVAGEIDHSLSPTLTLGQCLDVVAYTSADAVRWQALCDARDKPPDAIPKNISQHAVELETASLASHVSTASMTSATAPADAGDLPEAKSTAESESKHSSDDGSVLSGFPSFLAAGQWLSEEEDPRYQFVPVVNFELDISTVEELASATLLWDEIAAVEKIIAEAQQRRYASLEKLDQERAHQERGHQDRSEATSSVQHPERPLRASILRRWFESFKIRLIAPPTPCSITEEEVKPSCGRSFSRLLSVVTLGCVPFLDRRQPI